MKIKEVARDKTKQAVISVLNITNPKKKRKSPDYCSWSPDWICGVYIGNCCKNHDEDYLAGGTAADKKKADQRFRRCLYLTLRLKKIGRKIAGFWSWLYYRGVRLGPLFGFGDTFKD